MLRFRAWRGICASQRAPVNPASTNFQFVINPTKVGANYLLPQAAFWQAPVASDRCSRRYGVGGILRAVGGRDEWIGSQTLPALDRLTNFQFQKPSDWVTDALIASNAPATKASGYEGQLAENILGFGCSRSIRHRRPITTNASNAAYPNGEFDSTTGYRTVLTNGTNAGPHTFARALPASVEVAVVAVDARTAKRLTGSERPAPRTADMSNDVNTFYNGLAPEDQTGSAHLQHGHRPSKRSALVQMKPRGNPLSKRLGSALVMTLVIIVLITVVTVGYLASVMLETKTAGSSLDQERAYGVAMVGVHQAMAQIRDALGPWDDPYKNFAASNPPFYWSISPGRITRWSYSSVNPLTNIGLFSESTGTSLGESQPSAH